MFIDYLQSVRNLTIRLASSQLRVKVESSLINNDIVFLIYTLVAFKRKLYWLNKFLQKCISIYDIILATRYIQKKEQRKIQKIEWYLGAKLRCQTFDRLLNTFSLYNLVSDFRSMVLARYFIDVIYHVLKCN